LIQKDGEFVKATWDEALDLVASRLKTIHEANGQNSVAFQVSCRTTNEECYEMQKLARVGFKTNYVDNCARICRWTLVILRFGRGNKWFCRRSERGLHLHDRLKCVRSAPARCAKDHPGQRKGRTPNRLRSTVLNDGEAGGYLRALQALISNCLA
jgi:NADH dehydrogenase/NADH:ubiquinone oxidoreductase subunit G